MNEVDANGDDNPYVKKKKGGNFEMVTCETIQTNYNHYKHFMDHYGPKIVGHIEYKNACTTETPEEWMTEAEEAYGLLSLENYKDFVYEKVHNKKAVQPKWSVGGVAKRNMGYAEAGINRFDEIFEAVEKTRKDETNYGKEYMKYRQELEEGKIDANQKRKLENMEVRQGNRKSARKVTIPLHLL